MSTPTNQALANSNHSIACEVGQEWKDWGVPLERSWSEFTESCPAVMTAVNTVLLWSKLLHIFFSTFCQTEPAPFSAGPTTLVYSVTVFTSDLSLATNHVGCNVTTNPHSLPFKNFLVLTKKTIRKFRDTRVLPKLTSHFDWCN